MKTLPQLKEKKIVQWSIIFCSIVVVILSLVGDRGLIQLIDLKRQESNLKREIEDLKQEREDWIVRIKSIKTEKSYIETIAREQLGMVKNNEIVYELDVEDTDNPAAPPD